ncbi:RES family NAD+ phosphorylase [Clostridium felsineum]|uniref:RES family NAD+ phosphorylase n=1 Tax=Clostridium felsineum TaxID=36839 RepID=UPI00098C7317|nr:RES family NAD+ phosphorylase [Clostridium felsineum]URZ14158.1 hypothetical protein CLFE_001430 [Clostridium felsineum DSM 794]
MICCIECFRDTELKSMISSYEKKGDCEICGAKDTYIYDTVNDNYLAEYLDELLDVYTYKERLPCDYPVNLLNNLSKELVEKWRMFNISEEKVRELIINICKEKYDSESKLFIEPIGILELYDKDYLEKNCILKTHQWESFKYSITNINRFHSDHINTEVLGKLFGNMCSEYKTGTILYRARISDESGYKSKDMGAPPPRLISAGRANSEGISCLYLADNIDTTIHEIRARDLDYISVGSFELKKNIKVVDLSYIENFSPFSTGYDLTWLAVNIELLKKIGKEISKPLRRQDSILDYLPTQYISDFVKHLGYDGIKYKSTLSSDGNNFAIFSEKNFKCNKVEVYHINELEYHKKKVK